MSKEGQAIKSLFGMMVALPTLFILFPAWIYVMRSVLIRGDATDLEWVVFYGYCAGHAIAVVVNSVGSAIIDSADVK